MITILSISFGILEFEMCEQVTSLFWIWICGWVVRNEFLFWSLEGSYQTLRTLPDEIKQSTRTAVIIPAFFHTGWTIANGTLQEQVASVFNRIPFSMTDLLDCVKRRKCSPVKKGLFTHVFIESIITSSCMFLNNGLMTKTKEYLSISITIHVGRMIYKNRKYSHPIII